MPVIEMMNLPSNLRLHSIEAQIKFFYCMPNEISHLTVFRLMKLFSSQSVGEYTKDICSKKIKNMKELRYLIRILHHKFELLYQKAKFFILCLI